LPGPAVIEEENDSFLFYYSYVNAFLIMRGGASKPCVFPSWRFGMRANPLIAIHKKLDLDTGIIQSLTSASNKEDKHGKNFKRQSRC